MTKAIDMTGFRSGRLVALRRAGSLENKAAWLCECDCGGTKIVRGKHLRTHAIRSCGCILKEGGMHPPEKRHGHVTNGNPSPEWMAWRNMRARCTNPRVRNYPNYGGRGVTVCDRWSGSFKAFLEDMGPRPSPLHSLDRIDNDGNYDPDNCRWATRREQSRNKRTNVFVKHNGASMVLKDVASATGIPYTTIRSRLAQGVVLTEPKPKGHRADVPQQEAA